MTYTGYARRTTGQTLYCKPVPLNDSLWTDDDIAMTENGTLGSYSTDSALTESVGYEIFEQAGGGPANSDEAIGKFDVIELAVGEPAQGAPPVSATLSVKMSYIFKAWRNKKTQTATTVSVFDDAGSTVDHKATISDDNTTATVEEMVSGP